MNYEFIFVVFALGTISIVAIVYGQGELASKALDGLTGLTHGILKRINGKK